MLKYVVLTLLGFLCLSCSIEPSPEQSLFDLEAVEKASIEGIDVNFHGESCEVNVPDNLPIGEYHFRLNDMSELSKSDLYVAKISNGYTYQDLLNLQNYPGEYHLKPDWLVYAKNLKSVDPSTGHRSYDITLEPGNYAVYVYGFFPTGEEWLWFCLPINALENPGG